MTATCQIDALSTADIRPVAVLHQSAFPEFFLSSLGTPFLEEFYRGFLSDRSAVGLVARDEDGVVRGAVVGTLEPEGFFGRLVRRRLLAFALASARATIRSPRAAPRLVAALAYRGDPPPELASALLSSICVDSSRRSRGLGYTLLSQWTAEVAARGGQCAYLTTDATNNEAVNHFYQRAGWQLHAQFTTRGGRQMNRYATTMTGPKC